jgi:hypothetical protein
VARRARPGHEVASVGLVPVWEGRPMALRIKHTVTVGTNRLCTTIGSRWNTPHATLGVFARGSGAQPPGAVIASGNSTARRAEIGSPAGSVTIWGISRLGRPATTGNRPSYATNDRLRRPTRRIAARTRTTSVRPQTADGDAPRHVRGPRRRTGRPSKVGRRARDPTPTLVDRHSDPFGDGAAPETIIDSGQ